MLCIDGCRFYFSYQGERYCDWDHAFLSSATVGCGFGQPYDPDDLDEPIKRTNYDRIISKTPKELAKFMGELPCCPPGADLEELCYPMDSCEGTDLQVQCWLDWLGKEADE